MRQDNLEDILQQYGADRRQQQQAADNLHGLARQQKRRALMVCTAILLATTVCAVYLFALPQQTSNVIIARQEVPSVPQTPSQEQTQQSIPTTTQHKTKHTSSSTLPIPEPTVPQEYDIPYENTEPPAIAITQQALDTDTLHTKTPNTIEPPLPDVQPIYIQEPLLADNPVILPSDNEGKQFHFTASIGVSALPRIGADDVNTIENTLHSISGTSNSYTSMSPSSTLAANVGVNYAIPLGERQGLELGIGLSGYSHQAEVTTYNIGIVDGIDGTDNTTIYPAGKPEIHSAFSLYASLPLTFNFRPKGKDIGWNLSLTPSHSIATSNMLGNLTGNKSILNPWRLTMGLGLALPRGFIRRLSLTANLLSLYTSSSLHEIGIEIGF